MVLCLGSGYFTFQFYCHYFPKLKTDYIHCFSVAVIDYPNKKAIQRRKGFILAYSFKGNTIHHEREGLEAEARGPAWQSGSRMIFSSTPKQLRKGKQEVEPSYKTLKPTPTDILPPTRLNFLQNLTNHQHYLAATTVQIHECMQNIFHSNHNSNSTVFFIFCF